MTRTAKTVSRKQKTEGVRKAIWMFGHAWSDRVIANHVGVSNATVSRHRRAMEAAGEIWPKDTPERPVRTWPDEVCRSAIRRCPDNDLIYDPVRTDDASFEALVADVRENGVLEPIVVSHDGVILSGHRRHAAAQRAGLDRVPVRAETAVSYRDDRDAFIKRLTSHNRQRTKSATEQLREEVALMEDESCQRVRHFRRSCSVVKTDGVVMLGERRPRAMITEKLELREAIIQTIQGERFNWPLSARSVHYRLLNIPDLVRNDRTRTPYKNDIKSYKDTTDMITRMRLDGSIPMDSIADETRPVILWKTHKCVGDFVRDEVKGFLTGYQRELQQSQPNWVELLVEKNTVATQLKRLAGQYTIPMTSGRGYTSIPPRKDMVDRFRDSGREQLVVIVVSDFDPEGVNIPVSFGESLRDDFGVGEHELEIIQAALTADQVQSMDLHGEQIPKQDSSRYEGFVRVHGDSCWELEALTPEQLREIVEAKIRDVLDLDLFEAEVEKEQADGEELNHRRSQLRDVLFDGLDEFDGSDT